MKYYIMFEYLTSKKQLMRTRVYANSMEEVEQKIKEHKEEIAFQLVGWKLYELIDEVKIDVVEKEGEERED